ncbi:type I secretion system permease/ATPase [Zavarzinia sp. CC-PAN008]|uniref:type I secretion system permease/ATPase n=1 Tax=Zavarzinia sp. CC-PAN008 TaxID=3243332 RepID=UPI003F74A091
MAATRASARPAAFLRGLWRLPGLAHGLLIALVAISMVLNLLAFVLPLYSLQVFDRVLTARSLETLVALTAIALVLVVMQAALDGIRSRLCGRLAARVYDALAPDVFTASARRAVADPEAARTRPLADLDVVRGFLASPAPGALLDAPWTPLFVLVLFAIHPWLGATALAGVVLLLGGSMASEIASRRLSEQAMTGAAAAHLEAEQALRNADALAALGMLPALRARWLRRQYAALNDGSHAADGINVISSATRFIRYAIQIAMMALAAWLTLLGELTPGTVIAASVIAGRAFVPVEQAIGSWRSIVQARLAWTRCVTLVASHADRAAPQSALPPPSGAIALRNLVVTPPGAPAPIIRNVTLTLARGMSLGIIGPSGSGKSTLARALVGAVEVQGGSVLYDGAEIAQWPADVRGRHVGYLPQGIELFAGTVAENICRMGPVDSQAMLKASDLAHAHEMIVGLPGGYECWIGEGGRSLSAGQRQRIGLARALYGDPGLVVLDEPNAFLDGDGEQLLLRSFARIRAQGTTLVVIAHRPSIIQGLDAVALLRDGRVEDSGKPAEVFERLTRAAAANAAPLRPVQVTPRSGGPPN